LKKKRDWERRGRWEGCCRRREWSEETSEDTESVAHRKEE
jgi:hypothetical protein